MSDSEEEKSYAGRRTRNRKSSRQHQDEETQRKKSKDKDGWGYHSVKEVTKKEAESSSEYEGPDLPSKRQKLNEFGPQQIDKAIKKH